MCVCVCVQIGRDAKIIVWSSLTNQIIVRIPQYHEQRIYALAFSASGAGLVSVGAEGGGGGSAEGVRTRIVRWDWRTGAIEAAGQGPNETLTGLMFNQHSDDPNAMVTYGKIHAHAGARARTHTHTHGHGHTHGHTHTHTRTHTHTHTHTLTHTHTHGH